MDPGLKGVFLTSVEIQCVTIDDGWVGEGKLENGSSGFQELSSALHFSHVGLYFSPQKYSGMKLEISRAQMLHRVMLGSFFLRRALTCSK